ncbi:hypothetical protein PCC7418_0854 [Halothece sp. PCC 7418]|nr:hypothetical protein [Halothece sp. PCC 7418]AFZ43069.1 hypothetical protein PCC7418_0854 [Halothece sp. PCC 7418]
MRVDWERNMAIIALRAWYLQEYEPLREVMQRPHDLRLSTSSKT